MYVSYCAVVIVCNAISGASKVIRLKMRISLLFFHMICSHSVRCITNWYGDNCTEFVCDPQHNPCLNEGICIPDDATNDFTCDCPDDYGGPLCAYYEG